MPGAWAFGSMVNSMVRYKHLAIFWSKRESISPWRLRGRGEN
jgi:hypothetical protein